MQATPTSSIPSQSTPLSGRQRLQLKGGPNILSCASALIIGSSEGANKAVVRVAPSRKAQKPGALASVSPLLLSLAQSSSSVRCQPGNSVSSSSQPTVKRQKLNESINSTGPGMSAAAAIPIDDRADDDNEDDDNIKVLIDEGDDDGDDGTGAVANVDAQGNVKIGTSRTASATGGSGFSQFVLMDLDESAMGEIKGKNSRKFLNNLQRDYYDKDELWVKQLCLQLPQGPRSKHNRYDMMQYMILE